MDELYSLSFKDTDGATVKLADFKDKVLLIVNTATQCGLAGQFSELEALHQQFKDRGLVVLGFPCDQFMGQEPESNEDMVGVCQKNFGVTFLLSEKIDVNGAGAHPLFKYLKAHSKSALGKEIKWNFTKFLVAPANSQPIRRYAPTTSPASITAEIEKLVR